MIGMFCSLAQVSQIFIISVWRMPGYSFASSDVFLHIVHFAMQRLEYFIF